MKMCEDFFATHPEEKVIQMSKRDVIAYAITEEPNHDEFLQRLKINTERLKLHNKLRKNKKDKIENNKQKPNTLYTYHPVQHNNS